MDFVLEFDRITDRFFAFNPSFYFVVKGFDCLKRIYEADKIKGF